MYTFKPMRLHYAKEISKWEYSGFMKQIMMKPYFDNYNELTGEMKGPLKCDGYAVFKENQLIGIFEYYDIDEGVEIGLALHPEFVGKGNSKQFILEGIQYYIKNYNYNKDYIYLAVEVGNIAAYKAYLKFGFEVYLEDKEEIKMKYNINEM